MAADRVKIQDIIASQLPTYVREDFPLLGDFLQQYYVSQEFEGATYDLIQNLDQYVKVDELFDLTNSTVLASNVSYTDRTITADVSGNFTYGFPENNGLIKIDNEIIHYEYKTDSTFEGCTRGFSGVTSYTGSNTPDQLVFEETEADKHTAGATISNLNILFLQQFFKKIKYQFAPGFTERTLYSGLDQRNFVFGLDSFYNSKGTDESFKILFQALYGVNVDVIRPSEFLLRPSNADYKVTLDFVVETIQGNPLDLKNLTLFQKSTGARGSVTNVIPIDYDEGQYYQISIDTGYQRDIDVNGTIFGEFQVNPKTKLLNTVGAGTTILDVDSTVGFAKTGYLVTRDLDNNIINLSYGDKSSTQFLNVSGVDYQINEKTDIRFDDYSYGYVGLDTSNEVRVRISSTLKEFKTEGDTYGYRQGDVINIQSLGYESPYESSKNWFYNNKTSWDVSSISLVDSSTNTYEIVTFDSQEFRPGYNLSLISSVTSVSTNAIVLRVTSATSVIVRLTNAVDTDVVYTVENQILKGRSTDYTQLNDFFANVQNTYAKFNGDALVSSNSIARYVNKETNPDNRTKTFSGSFNNDYNIIIPDHGFYTGQAVYYQPGVTKTTTTTPDGIKVVTETESKFAGVNAGVFYINRVDSDTVNFARSKSDIFAGKFVLLNGNVENNVLTFYEFYGKNVSPQSIYREITSPSPEPGTYTTEFGHIGILVNGVEITNYKSRDTIRYGEIQSINPTSGGSGYDVINPPVLHIDDEVGVGATGTCSVTGSLQRIEIIDPGFDYQGTPTVEISGGNGSGAVARVNMTSVQHSVSFIADINSTDISLTDNTIGFSTFHKFRDNEKVIYVTDSETGVGGLSTGAQYHVSVVDSSTVKLHNTESDSVLGINTVSLTSYGSGTQSLRSLSLKRIVSDIVVSNSGSGYENNQRNIPANTGINTALNQFNILNHGYESKEIIKYTGSNVIGLSTTKDYYVVKINDNAFSLTEVGVGSTAVDYFYNNSIQVDIQSEGSGSFNYKPISVRVDGITGVSTRTGQDFNAVVQPIFRGPISAFDVSNNGVGYGSSEVINFDRQPSITFVNGAQANVTPVISNGKIVEVVINNGGYGYNSPPNLTISGSGNFAVLTPEISGGKITNIKVVKSGAGYRQGDTFVTVTPAGSGASAVANIRNWTVNLFTERFNNIKSDDGFLIPNINNTSLQYSALYAPRPLRESVYGISGNGGDNTVYGIQDLTTRNNSETESAFHSPIIGWAYDGNPIYGPYGFANPDGSGDIRRMVSGYELGPIAGLDLGNQPPVGTWVNGFFVEDYIYTGNGDLDHHNGRFCITPDYPKGVYAYFTTISDTIDSSGPFQNYRQPQFPYLIGNTYHSEPNQFNFKSVSNQTDYAVQDNGWFRETTSYHTNSARSNYNYLFDSTKVVKQLTEVSATSNGTIENIGILTGGQGYKVGDKIDFNNEGTGGRLADIKVDRVLGNKIDTVSLATTSFSNVEFTRSTVVKNRFIGFTTQPHNFLNNDVVNISGVSTYYDGFTGSYSVGVRSDNFVLTLGVGTAGATGIVTYFYVSGAFDNSHVRENDILTIDQEKVRVLNIDSRTGRFRVRREEEGTTGLAYTSSSVLYEDPRKFTINVGAIRTDFSFPINRELYFDPAESIAIGTAIGTGLGSTITFGDPGVGQTQVFIEPQQVYIPGHRLKLNDRVFYSTNGGDSIQIWNGQTGSAYTSLSLYSPLYAVPFNESFVGFGTNKVGLNSTGGYTGVGTDTGLVYFTNVGSGDTHSFTTDLTSVLSGKVSRNIVTVATATTHTLQKGDAVYMTVKPTGITTVTVKYDDYNRRIVFDPQTFAAGDVNTTLDTITISNNPFKFGDRVIHTSTSPSGGLVDEGMYYIIPYEENRIRLVSDKFELSSLDPKFVNLTSASAGTLSKINPAVNITKNNTLKFDLSDSSLSFVVNGIRYSAYDMNLYTDAVYDQLFLKTPDSTSFQVVKTGKPGIDADASLQLEFVDNVPNQLFYKFDIDNESIITDVKKEISIDSNVPNHSQIDVVLSPFDGRHVITGIGTTTFQYDIPETSSVTEYNYINSVPTYETNSQNVTGSITKFRIDGPGVGYKVLPGINSVRSASGTGAIVRPESTNIGKILETKFNNIGFDYPSDPTVRVVSNLPEVLKVESLTSFESIGIASQGRNYLVAPNLVVIDGYSEKIVTGLDLAYDLGDEEVEIIDNSTGMYNVDPRIIPVNNSNGLGIASVSYDNSTKVVRAYIDRNFTTAEADQFNFPIGSKVLVENLSVGVGSTGVGYNSSDYEYTFFEVTGFDKKLDSVKPYVDYSLVGLIENGEIPGNLDLDNSYGRIVNTQDFPIYTPVLKTNDYLVGETVVNVDGLTGRVERWNSTTEQLIVSSSGEFNVGSKIIGRSSGTQSIVETKVNFNSQTLTGAGATVVDGWQTNSGFLNDNLQKLPNNEYYQNFSYSLNSTIPYDTWNDPVSALDHTAGFAKFADLDIISKEEESRAIVQTFNSDVERVVDIVGEASLNCEYDWDLVAEETINIGNDVVSTDIIFSNKVIKDYANAVGNRVLPIDDISDQFQSNERTTNFAVIDEFTNAEVYNKFFTYVRDTTDTDERQFSIVVVNQEGVNNYIQEYAKMEINNELGTFDVIDTATGWDLYFYPEQFAYNSYDITTLSFNIFDNSVVEKDDFFGNVVMVASATTEASPGITTTIVSIANTYRSAKVLVMTEDQNGEASGQELNIIHDGTDVSLLKYGDMVTSDDPLFVGVGTFDSRIDGSNLIVEFTPTSGLTTMTVNSSVVAIAATGTGIGSTALETSLLKSTTASIAADASPVPVTVASYDNPYGATYFVVSASDTTNSEYEMFECVILNDSNQQQIIEFGNVQTVSGVGTVGVAQTVGTTVDLTFTPNPNSAVTVKTFAISLQEFNNNGEATTYDNGLVQIKSLREGYVGTRVDVTSSFGLKSGGFDIFKRSFDGSSSSVVDVTKQTVRINDHFFVTGERVFYGYGTTPIGIETATVPGIGSTTLLPQDLYVVKASANEIKFASTAENALKATPEVLLINAVGVGESHSITSTNQNAKCLVAIDNMIQSPISETNIYSTLDADVILGPTLETTGITSFYADDIILVDQEYMIVTGLGGDNPTDLQVLRGQMGSLTVPHTAGTTIQKFVGQYNITGSTINFVGPAEGKTPLSTTTGNPNYRDWTGITTNSTFQGRVFTRTAPVGSSSETYSNNYVFDDISQEFTGIRSEFTLQQSDANTVGYSTYNGIFILNGIFQQPSSPTVTNAYTLAEGSGITTITFQGNGVQDGYDPNKTNIPLRGRIISVGSTQGFGFQPLVAAGGTAVVSTAGTISSIAIGRTGSGYRSGIQTVVNVGVQTSSEGNVNLEFIGTAAISGGHIVSIAITNPGTGYTSTNPPEVVIDAPLSYTNLSLVYSGVTTAGVGTDAKVDIVVGQGSSVIDFTITQTGFNYGNDEILTVAIGGTVGIPTDTTKTYEEFQLTVESIYNDSFNGWTIGSLQVMDSLDSLFDGTRRKFPMSVAGIVTSIETDFGGPIDLDYNLLVFINDILQQPVVAYTFEGGSHITFSEAPQLGDSSHILFYRGTMPIDVPVEEILNNIKEGDILNIENDPSRGQKEDLDQDPRTVTEVVTNDTAETNPYRGPGITENDTLERPVIWCRQTVDKIIDGKPVAKDRENYEPNIFGAAYLLQPVGVGSTVAYVDNVTPIFDQFNELDRSNASYQEKIVLTSQDTLTAAAATATVSTAGTITAFTVTTAGFGYTVAPSVTVSTPVGVGTTQRATGTAVLSGSTVGSITVTSPGTGYSSVAPAVLIESPVTVTDTLTVTDYSGDFGIVVGVGTTTSGSQSQFYFDTFVPLDSVIRDYSFVGLGSTSISGISTGDYLVVTNTNLSVGGTFASQNTAGGHIGIATTALDCVYQVASFEDNTISIAGVGATTSRRIFVNVDNSGSIGYTTAPYMGDFSWGKITMENSSQSYNFYGDDGVSGISTSGLITRYNPLKAVGYTTA
jgi:hypothetical protein